MGGYRPVPFLGGKLRAVCREGVPRATGFCAIQQGDGAFVIRKFGDYPVFDEKIGNAVNSQKVGTGFANW
jgi:hypothetical protein